MGWSASAAERLSSPVPEHAYLSYLDENVVTFPGHTAEKSFYLRLPEHVRYREGCKLILVLRAADTLLDDVCSLNILVNDATIFTGTSGPNLSTNRNLISLIVPVAVDHLIPDWNRISLVFTLQKHDSTSGPAPQDLQWEIRRSESFFDFTFERVPLFPELRRFPLSMVEEELLQTASIISRSAEPSVSILLPDARRDIYARSVAVLGAALGKPGYLNACQLLPVTDWDEASLRSNGILVARRDELDGLPLPDHVQQPLTLMQVGEGMIAEIITGTPTNQHRWIVLSGADDVGLEKALLTLSHGPALLGAPPNPAVIRSEPLVAGRLETEASSNPTVIPLRTPRHPNLYFRGIYESEQTFTGWRLPPGYHTGPGTLINLIFSHSPALTTETSYFEILVNGSSVATIHLGPDTSTNSTVQVSLPSGLRGQNTMALTFRAHLDLAAARCDPPSTREAWLTISGDSFLESVPAVAEVADLSQLKSMLVSDLFLRQTVFLLPQATSSKEMQWFLDFCLALGGGLSSSSVLWPDAMHYTPGRPIQENRLRDKTPIMFGSLADVSASLPASAHPLIRMRSREARHVIVQGGAYPVNRFDESMGLLMLHSSPWSADRPLITACGIHTFALPSLHRLMQDPKSAGKKYGTISAMDDHGRWLGYDPKRGPEPLADAIWNRIPAGLDLEETLLRERESDLRSRRIYQMNFAVMVWTGAILILLIACRLWLTWERAHMHQRQTSDWSAKAKGGA